MLIIVFVFRDAGLSSSDNDNDSSSSISSSPRTQPTIHTGITEQGKNLFLITFIYFWIVKL